MSLDEFHTILDRLGRTPGSWGFIVIRTAAAADDSQWNKAYDKLRRLVLRSAGVVDEVHTGRQHIKARAHPDSAVKPPDLFSLPVLDLRTVRADQGSLDGLRDLINRHVSGSRQGNQGSPKRENDSKDVDDVDDDDDDEDRRTTLHSSKLHLGGYLVVDKVAMTELLTASNLSGIEPSGDEPRPTVIFLDAVDPRNVNYQGGPPFMGWMRVEVQALIDLELDLALHGHDAEQRSRKIYPHRQWYGQIPVYRGQRNASFIDARPDVTAEKYMFPRGTPRGWQGTVATWESIPEEYRGRQRLGPPPAWFIRQQQQQKAEERFKD